jgi:hypothetical protein
MQLRFFYFIFGETMPGMRLTYEPLGASWHPTGRNFFGHYFEGNSIDHVSNQSHWNKMIRQPSRRPCLTLVPLPRPTKNNPFIQLRKPFERVYRRTIMHSFSNRTGTHLSDQRRSTFYSSRNLLQQDTRRSIWAGVCKRHLCLSMCCGVMTF